jgi:hypothetical protein
MQEAGECAGWYVEGSGKRLGQLPGGASLAALYLGNGLEGAAGTLGQLALCQVKCAPCLPEPRARCIAYTLSQ